MVIIQRISEALSSAGWLTICLASILGFLVMKALFTRRKGLPPGPTGLPLIGYYPFLTKEPFKKLRDLSKTYGGILHFKVFGTDVIHISSSEDIRQAFATQGNEFAGRPGNYFDVGSPILNIGVLASEGDLWKVHRRFALSTLRDFGFGKQSLESRVHQIAEDLVQAFDEPKGNPIDVHDLLANATANVICSMLFDVKYKMNDPQFQKILKTIRMSIENIPFSQQLLTAVPLIRFFPVKYAPGGKEILKVIQDFVEVGTELIEEHRKTFDPMFLRDYVDVYIDEMKKTGDKADEKDFTTIRLQGQIIDLFFAGTETTSTTLHWALRILMFRPEMQRKIQSEIDEMIGRERLPSITDRQNMPYMEAVIHEVLRFSSIAPLNLFHSNPEEVKLREFIIPKRSVIITNTWAVHHNPKYWPEPEKFNPARFLSEDGKFQKRDHFYPFSIGKRSCLGETLARMELFIFLTAIFQRFSIEPQAGDTQKELKINPTLILSVDPYKLCARGRY